MKLGSLFDGSGGFPLAGAIHGITPAWASEIEPYPIKVTKARFPGMKHLGSVLDVDGGKVEPVDIITFGSPCQDLSVAGKQAGLHKGERSNLFFEAIRIIKEMREATNGTYPRIAIWENVPGAYSSNKGEDFRAVLQAFCSVKDEAADVPRPASGKWHPAGAIVGNGWSIAWRTFDAQFWGVPQRRKRIYLIADFGSERAGEILFEQEGVRGHSAESGTAGQSAAGDAERGVGRGCEPVGFQSSQSGFRLCATHATLDANNGSRRQNGVCYPAPGGAEGSVGGSGVNGLAPQDVQSFGHDKRSAKFTDDGKTDPLTATDYKDPMIVAYPAPTICFKERAGCPGGGNGILCGDKPFTLSTLTDQAVCYAAAFMGGQGDRARSIAWTENATPPLKAVPSGSNTVPDVCYAVRTAQTNANGIGVAQDAHTLDGANAQAVCYPIDSHQQDSRFRICEDGVCPTVPGQMGTGGNNGPMVLYTKQAIGHYCELKVASTQQARQYKSADDLVVSSAKPPRKYIIRRLTPLECLRLQGLPDGWLDGVDGSDSAKYKMLGNGIAMPNAIYVVGCAVQLLQEGKHENEG